MLFPCSKIAIIDSVFQRDMMVTKTSCQSSVRQTHKSHEKSLNRTDISFFIISSSFPVITFDCQ